MVRVRFHGVPLREALGKVFDAAHVSYSIRSDVRDEMVSCVVLHASLESAVHTILASVVEPLEYRVEMETYYVTRGRSMRHPAAGNIPSPQAGGIEIEPGAKGMDSLVSLDAAQADVRDLLARLFASKGVSFAIDTQVQGQVTLSLRNVSFRTALDNIARQVGATYAIEQDVVKILPASKG
jgi:type II secretory pathway component GspD/PulD (secretin)